VHQRVLLLMIPRRLRSQDLTLAIHRGK